MKKDELRRNFLARRRDLAAAEHERLSAEICRRIETAPWFVSAAALLMYMPFRQEVDIRPLMETAWQKGKAVYLPKVDRTAQSMSIHRVYAFKDLEPGAYGILEPVTEASERGGMPELDAVFVPGVVFDRQGHRIGYGGGYFDRFLAALNKGTSFIGVAFSFQVVASLPYESHDRRLHALVTEKETVWFS